MSFKDLIGGLQKELMNDGGSSGAGRVQFLLSNKAYEIKFLMPEGKEWNDDGTAEDNKFWAVFDDVDQKGLPCKAYLVCGVVVNADDDKSVDTENVRYIKLKQTALKAIIAQLDAGFDVLGTDGPTFSCKTLKEQPWFTISAIPKKGKGGGFNSFDASNVTYPEMSLVDAAKAETDKVQKPKSSKVVLQEEDLPF